MTVAIILNNIIDVCLYRLRVRSVNSLGFIAGMLVLLRPSRFEKIQPTEKSIGWHRCKRVRWIFFVSEHPKKKKAGGLGVNKRNRGYPADYEFIERPLSFTNFL